VPIRVAEVAADLTSEILWWRETGAPDVLERPWQVGLLIEGMHDE
jgi:hypothetical protein